MPKNGEPIKYSDLISPDNSIQNLIKQLDELSDTYVNAMRNIKTEAEALAKTLKTVSGATESGREATRKAATDADRLAKAQKELAFAESERARELAELRQATQEQNRINQLVTKINNSAEGSYNRLSAQYSLNKIRLNSMTQAEREQAEATEGLVTQTRQLYEEMNRLQVETGKHQLNVGNYTQVSDAMIGYADSLKGAFGLNNAFGESLLSLGAGGNAATNVFTGLANGAKALGKTLMGLLANPVFLAIAGIAGVAAGFKWWYDYNAGLQEATRLTQQFTGLTGNALKSVRNQVTVIADEFDSDFNEVLRSANAVSKQFGISAQEALDLMQQGLVSGANANGEFFDTLREYPAYFNEAGLSAEQFIAIVTQTAQQGIFSDKGVDTIKEANLRLREMTTATASALEGIGLSSTEIQNALQTGTMTTFDVIQQVSARLNELPDSAASVGTAIADIFGGPGEDAGLAYLRTLKDIELSMDTVTQKTGELGELQEEQLRSRLELQNAVSALFDQTGGVFERMTTGVKVFINDALTGLITGVIKLINYIVELYNDSVLIRGVWNVITTVVKNSVDFIGNVFRMIAEMAGGLADIIKGIFTLDWKEMNEGASRVLAAIPNMVKETIKDSKENLRQGIDNMNKTLKPIEIPVNVAGEPTEARTRVTTGTPTAGKGDAEKAAKEEAKRLEEVYKKNLAATRKLQDALLALEADSYDKRRQETQLNYNRQIEDLQHQLATEKDLTTQGREAINAQIEVLEQQLTNDLLRLEQERQAEELKLQQQGIELRLQTVAQGSAEELELRRQLIENQRQQALLQNEMQPEGQRQEAGLISAGFDVQQGQLADEYLQAQLAMFDQQQDLAQSEFDLLRTTEGQKTRFRLQAEKERLQKVLELNEQASQKMSEAEVQTIQNTIAKIDQEIAQSKSEERTGDIYSIFGLNLSDDVKQGINTWVSYMVDALNTVLQARIDAANKAVEAADKEVEAAEEALRAEIEARRQGYEANVLQAQKDLALAKSNQQKALQEQQKAQKAQEALNTITQVSSLITASANLWSAFSSIPVVGPALAIGAIATMFASFAASKIMAAQYAKETYGEGTVELLQGGSHQSGNDVDLGTKPNGVRRRAEGGEFFAVINKRSSRKYRNIIPSVIKSLNNSTFEQQYMAAFAGGNIINVESSDKDISRMADDIKAIRKNGEKRTMVDSKGRTIIIYKGIKRIVS